MEYEYIQQNVGFYYKKKNFTKTTTWGGGLKNNFVQFPDHNHMSAAFYRE